ncbi:hypothetical protein ASC94_15535 [Massilia sp. Root418]|uniref:DUF971 domain-containing protein n=1 Tax=Massilia sp. Root418 TaxID=1736532 RepID=UPI0006F81D34|nr:DUF971 domain-containing protein [Massilia sp. Root418]KQW93960.1 hypothetical protein ASC94_15535 [Massilia sp. Root418]
MSIQSISNHPARGMLEIVLDSGASRTLTHATLREGCRCADCTALRRAGTPLQADGAIRLLAVEPVGAYGVQLVFSDRHDRGIYPWIYLEQLSDRAASGPPLP